MTNNSNNSGLVKEQDVKKNKKTENYPWVHNKWLWGRESGCISKDYVNFPEYGLASLFYHLTGSEWIEYPHKEL